MIRQIWLKKDVCILLSFKLYVGSKLLYALIEALHVLTQKGK